MPYEVYTLFGDPRAPSTFPAQLSALGVSEADDPNPNLGLRLRLPQLHYIRLHLQICRLSCRSCSASLPPPGWQVCPAARKPTIPMRRPAQTATRASERHPSSVLGASVWLIRGVDSHTRVHIPAGLLCCKSGTEAELRAAPEQARAHNTRPRLLCDSNMRLHSACRACKSGEDRSAAVFRASSVSFQPPMSWHCWSYMRWLDFLSG